jgi:hypothetical protein
MLSESIYKSFVDREFEPKGLPLNYPVPLCENLLFFIQRNTNKNTIVYELNLNSSGQLVFDLPLNIYWLEFSQGNEIKTCLNYIQNSLAYGYNSKVITNDLIEFQFVCHPKKFYIRKRNNDYEVVTEMGGGMHVLKNIYVYAEEFGIFPTVKFIEFYGYNVESKLAIKDKIFI